MTRAKNSTHTCEIRAIANPLLLNVREDLRVNQARAIAKPTHSNVKSGYIKRQHHRTARPMRMEYLILACYYLDVIQAVIFSPPSSTHAHSLPVHSAPPPAHESGTMVVVTMLAIYIVEKICTTKCFKTVARHMFQKFSPSPESPLHAAYQAAKAHLNKEHYSAESGFGRGGGRMTRKPWNRERRRRRSYSPIRDIFDEEDSQERPRRGTQPSYIDGNPLPGTAFADHSLPPIRQPIPKPEIDSPEPKDQAPEPPAPIVFSIERKEESGDPAPKTQDDISVLSEATKVIKLPDYCSDEFATTLSMRYFVSMYFSKAFLYTLPIRCLLLVGMCFHNSVFHVWWRYSAPVTLFVLLFPVGLTTMSKYCPPVERLNHLVAGIQGKKKASNSCHDTVATDKESRDVTRNSDALSLSSFEIAFVECKPNKPQNESIPESSIENIVAILGGNSPARAVGTFLVSLLTMPSFRSDKVRCTLHVANTFQSLFVSLTQIYGQPRITEILTTFTDEVCTSFGYSAESGDASIGTSWLEKFADGFDQLAKFTDTPVGNILGAGIALVTSLPLLISKAYSSDSALKQWKILQSLFKQTGASISTILKTLVGVQRDVLCSETSLSPKGVLSYLLTHETTQSEFVECRARFRNLLLGNDTITALESTEFLDRCKRLEKRCIRAASVAGCSPMQLSMAKDATELLSGVRAWHVQRSPRMVPFTWSLVGGPGVGKSTVADNIVVLLHTWNGYLDIMNSATILLQGKTDEVTTNATTSIMIDDGGNTKGTMRTAENCLSAFLLANVQPSYRSILKADLPDKNKHHYHNLFTCMIDNHGECGISQELIVAQAGLRRKGYSAEMKCRPEYEDPLRPGCVCPIKAKGLMWGEHAVFRPHIWIQESPTEPSREKNWFEGSGWVDHHVYFKWMKEMSAQHFKQQREILAAKMLCKVQPLCPVCGILPYSACLCAGTDKDFMDAEMFAESGIMSYMNPLRTPAVPFLDFLSAEMKLYLCSSSLVARLFFAWFSNPIAELWFSLSILSLLSAVDQERPFTIAAHRFQLASQICVVISLVTLLFTKICRFLWARLRYRTIPEIMERHVAGITQFSSTFKIAMVSMALLLTVPTLWKTLMDLLPDKKVAESEITLTPTQEVCEEVPSKPPPPIWAPVKRTPFQASHQARTIDQLSLLKFAQNNCLPVSISFEGVDQKCNLFFINTKIAVSSAHSFVFQGETRNVTISYDGGKPLRIYTSQMFVVEGKDLIFIYVDGAFGSKKDLSLYLPENKTDRGFFYKIAKTPTDEWSSEKVTANLVANATYSTPNHGIALLPQELYTVKGTMMETKNGHCGAPYVSASIASVIAAIHVAGNKKTGGFAIPLLLPDYVLARTAFGQQGFEIPLEVIPYQIQAGEFAAESQIDPKHPVNFLPNDGRELEVLRDTAHNYTPRSALLTNPEIKAAMELLKVRLLKKKPFMQIRKSCYKILERCTRPRDLGDVNMLMAAQSLLYGQVVKPVMDRTVLEEFQTRPLTYHEVLNGIPGKVQSILLSTSSGVGGKKRLYVEGEIGERKLVPEMENDCEKILEFVKSCKAPFLPATACLKDEARGLDKDTQRLFYNPTMQQFVLLARYLRCILDLVAANGRDFSTAIGYDPVGANWVEVIEPFAQAQFIGNCFDLDYEAFDASQSSRLRNVACKIFVDIAALAWEDPEEVETLRKLLSWANSTPADMLGVVMQLEALLLSGMIYTAHANGFITLLIVTVDFVRFWSNRGEIPMFKEHVCLITLGDDTVGAVSTEMRMQGWTQEHLVETAASYGLVLTTAAKDTNFVFKTFPQCEFLKRRYSYNEELGINVSALSPASYLQPFHLFHRAPMTLEEYQADQCNTALLEALAGGRESFTTMQQRFIDYYNVVPQGKPEGLTWDYDMKCAERREFLERQPPLFPVTGVGMELIREYDNLPETALEKQKKLEFAHCVYTYTSLHTTYVGGVDYACESEPEETAVLQTLEGEVEDFAGYQNVNASASRMPLVPETKPEAVLKRRQLLRSVELPLAEGIVFYPELEMTKQPIYESRGANMAYRASGIKLTVVATCPSVITGCVIMSIHHGLGLTRSVEIKDGSNSSLMLATQLPHVCIRLGEAQNIWHLEVPFISQDVVKYSHDSELYSQPGVSIIEAVPITGALGTTAKVTLKIYGEWSGLQLFGATAIQNPGEIPYQAESEPGSEIPLDWGDIEDSESVLSFPCVPAWLISEDERDAEAALAESGRPTRPEIVYARGYCYMAGIDPKFIEAEFAVMQTIGRFPTGDQLMQHLAVVSSKTKVRVEVEFETMLVHVIADPYAQHNMAHYANVFNTFRFGAELPEKISTKILRVSNMAEQVLNIPGMSATPLAMMRTPNEILQTVGNALQKFGFSKPISSAEARPSAYFSNSNGADYGDVLATDVACEVTPGLPTSSQDEMTFASISRKWNIITRFKIGSSAVPGTVLFDANVTPTILQDGRPACCAAPSLFTTYWRGSMEYKFVLYCPLLVAVRLLVYWDPLGPQHPDALGSPAVRAEDFVEHIILDSSKRQETEITVGYMSKYSCLRNWSVKNKLLTDYDSWKNTSTYDEGLHNGYLRVELLDKVSGSVPPDLYVLVYARAGPDMQWGSYYGQCAPGTGVWLAASDDDNLPANEAYCEKQIIKADPMCAESLLVPPKETPVPTRIPTTLQPTTAPPTAPPTSREPTAAPSTVKPTAAPTTMRPTAAPTTKYPTVAPTLLATPEPTPDRCIMIQKWSEAYADNNSDTHYNRGGGITLADVKDGSVPNYTQGKTTMYWHRYKPNSTQARSPIWTVTFGPTCISAFEFRIKKTVAGARGRWLLSTERNPTDQEVIEDLSAMAVEWSATANPVDPIYYNARCSFPGGQCFNTQASGWSALHSNRSVVYIWNEVHNPDDFLEVGRVISMNVPPTHNWAHSTPCFGRNHPTRPHQFLATKNRYLPQATLALREPSAETFWASATVLQRSAQGGILGDFFAWDDWLIFHLDDYLSTDPASEYDRVPVQFVWYGGLTITSDEGCLWFAESQAKWNETVLSLPRTGFLMFCPSDGGRNGVARVSVFSHKTQSWYDADFRKWPPVKARRLRETYNFLEYLKPTNSTYEAEAEVVEQATTEVSSHHMGGPIDDSEFFVRMCMGEQLLSFRTLLKIPSPTTTIDLTGPGEYVSVTSIHRPKTQGFTPDLYDFLGASFLGWRGSLVFHYELLGHCSVEVSKTDTTVARHPHAMGVSFTNSYVNPKLTVKFPWQEPQLFHYNWEDFTVRKTVRVFKPDKDLVKVREYRSTGEDFSFHYFNGFPKLVQQIQN